MGGPLYHITADLRVPLVTGRILCSIKLGNTIAEPCGGDSNACS